MAGPEVLHRLVAAARASDADAVRSLIDWPVSGGITMLHALADVRPEDRAEVFEAGFAQLIRAADDPDLVNNAIFFQAHHLVPATAIEPAGVEVREATLATIHVPPLPEGFPPEIAERAEALRARINAVTDVYLVLGPDGTQPYAITPDSGLVVALLD